MQSVKELTEFERDAVIKYNHCNKSVHVISMSMFNCKCYYCKVEVFRNHSTDHVKLQSRVTAEAHSA